MKLNKVEKVIIVVIVIGLILGLGIWFFVVPSYQSIGSAQKTYDNNVKERDALYERLARLDTIDADIDAQMDTAKEYEKFFYPDMTNYEVIEATLAYLRSKDLETHGITASGMGTRAFSLSYFAPSELSYPLKEYSRAARAYLDSSDEEEVLVSGQFKEGGKVYTINVNSVADVSITDSEGNVVEPKNYSDNMLKWYKAALCRYVAGSGFGETVGAITASFTINCTNDQYMDFIDYIYSLERATTVPSVIIPMTIEPDPEALYVDESGNIVRGSEAGAGTEAEIDAQQLIERSISLIYLTVEPMEKLHSIDIEGTEIIVDQEPAVY